MIQCFYFAFSESQIFTSQKKMVVWVGVDAFCRAAGFASKIMSYEKYLKCKKKEDDPPRIL